MGLDFNITNTTKVVQGTSNTGSETTNSGMFYATVDISFSGFTSIPSVYATNSSVLTSWVSAITPITTTTATIFLVSTQTGFVTGKTINWTAIGN